MRKLASNCVRPRLLGSCEEGDGVRSMEAVRSKMVLDPSRLGLVTRISTACRSFLSKVTLA